MLLVAWIYTIGILMLRPTFFGETFTPIGLIMVISSIIIYRLKKKPDIKINKKINIWVMVFLAFWAYLLFLALFFQKEGVQFLIQSFITNIFVMVISIILFEDEALLKKIIRILSSMLFITAISYCVTTVLSLIIPVDNLCLMKLYSETYKTTGFLYFPITPIYTFMTIPGGPRMLRFLSVFREPGIASAFLIWLFVMVLNNHIKIMKNKRVVKLILLVSIIGTFSTSGIVVLIFTLLIRFLLNSRGKKTYLNIVIAMILSIGGIYMLFEAPYIGINNKVITHRESITDRSSAVEDGFKKVLNNPIGVGLYGDQSEGTNAVNLIAASYQIGILGVILMIAIYFIPLIDNRNNKYFQSIMPIFLTLLFSQPIIDTPFVIIIILATIKICKLQRI